MNKIAEAFIKVAERYETLARCEPDFNHAQHLRALARGLKHEAFELAKDEHTKECGWHKDWHDCTCGAFTLKETDNGNGNPV